MIKREAGCPLCGAKMTARELLDAGSSLLDLNLGVISARCPHCQGYLELRPVAGQVDLGYLAGKENPRFDVAMSQPFAGLVVVRWEDSLVLQVENAEWSFSE